MRVRNRGLLGLLCLAGLCLRPGERGAPPAARQRLVIVRCHDGDTCTARAESGVHLTLRLLGIDAPEVATHFGGRARPAQRFGVEARNYLERRVAGRSLPVELRGNDVYRRYLAVLLDDDGITNINEELVAKGFAFAYRGRGGDAEARHWAEAAEARARRERAGFWALPTAEQPQEPGSYRHAQ
ncbi:MAG: thermonuclease family protein [Bdellovibrionales bacterium]|nr:thermonuclease family protein [Bdellovibrionales bacterium]